MPRHLLFPFVLMLVQATVFGSTFSINKLAAALGQGAHNLSHNVLLLAELLSIPAGDRYPHLDLSPQKRKEATPTALAAQVAGLAAQQPVLMVVEDTHWVDATSPAAGSDR